MKKMVSLLFIVCVLMVSGSSVFADNNKGAEPFDREINSVRGILQNEYGEMYAVNVKIERPTMVGINSMGEQYYQQKVTIDTSDATPLSATTDSNYREKWDSSGGVKATSTIYFKSNSDPKTYLLTKVTAGYSVADATIVVTDQALVASCNGLSANGIAVNNQRKEYSPSSTPTTYTTGFSKYVTSDYGLVGTAYTVYLKRGGSTWFFTLQNTIAGSISL